MSAAQISVLACYTDGTTSVVRAGAAVDDWSAPTTCAGWDARDLAGHVLAIINYYNGLLDAATAGRPRRDLPRGDRLNQMNAEDLAALPATSGPERMAEFAREADRHAARLHAVDWDLVLGSWDDLGPLTVGQHTGLALGEWHLHAWDFAQLTGRDHRPADAGTVAAGRARVFASHAVGDGPASNPASSVAGDPWTATLRATGRNL